MKGDWWEKHKEGKQTGTGKVRKCENGDTNLALTPILTLPLTLTVTLKPT